MEQEHMNKTDSSRLQKINQLIFPHYRRLQKKEEVYTSTLLGSTKATTG